MSLFGKILAVLNILAALAFIFLVAVDWGQRQTWSYAVYRYDLALDGLPLDDETRSADGTLQVNRLSDATMQDLFKSFGPVPSPLTPQDKTQEAEVRRVHDRLRRDIDAEQDPAKKRALLASILVPLERTGGERDALREKIAREPVDALLADSGPFERAFKTALARQTQTGQALDPAQRRQAVAHLLFNVNDPASKNFEREYQRVLVVIGLKAFADEADLQASALRDMADRARLLLADDQATFEAAYQRGLSELNGLANIVEARKAKLAEYKRVTKRQQDLVKVRQADVAELKTRLDQARQASMAALAKLSAEQQKLFDYERQVGDTTAKNQQLEREIRSLEKGGH
jgi:hypothetical protein